MTRFKIHIQYDGTSFHGWQTQKNAKTIQGEFEKVLIKFSHGIKINVIGSGRTDSGVHALDQVAHFDLNTQMKPKELLSALNGQLPPDIRITNCDTVSDNFHARYSAIKRFYLYQCRTNDYLMDRFSVWQTGPLDLKILNKVSTLLLGTHDFTSFSKFNPDIENRLCNIYLSEWTKSGSIVNYRVVANRFLHHMVRYLVGTMIEVEKGKITFPEFIELLHNPREDVHVHKAPAQGLFLEKIEYNETNIYD